MRAHLAAAWICALFLSASLFSGTVALRLLLLLAGASLCAWIAWRDRSVRSLPPLWMPFALYALWAALSLSWSIDPDRSAKEFRNEVIYTALAFWMCYVAAQARDAVRIVLNIVALASAAVCVVAVYHFVWQAGEYGLGAHGGPGAHSSVLLALMPFAVVAGLHVWREGGRRWIACLAWGLALLFAVSAYTTLNRTVWLGFAVQLILVAGLLGRRSRVEMARGKLAYAAVAAAIAAAALALSFTVHMERAATIGVLPVEEDPRFAVWREAFERVQERPLAGYGFGRGQLRRELTSGTNDHQAWHSHNLFLETAVELGSVGLLLLLALLGATLRHGWLMIRRGDAIGMACGAAVLALVAGMLVRNMTDVLLVRHVALLYWGSLGVLLAWGQRPSPMRSP